MKKALIFLLSISTILCVICSCSKYNFETYKIYQVGAYEYTSGAEHSSELELKNETVNKLKIIKTKTVNVFGEEYEVTYDESQKGYLYNCEWDCYEYSNDEMGVSVKINTKTGNTDYCYVAMKRGYEKEYMDKMTRDECLEIAKEYFATFVDDAENYELTKEYDRSIGYKFYFSRYIDGVETRDGGSIFVELDGSIKSYHFECLSELKDVQLPSESTIEDIKSNVDKKLDEIYDEINDKYEITYGEKELIFARFADGTYGFEIFVDVTLASVNSDTAFDESNHFVVYID